MFERYSEMARRVIHMSRYMAGRVGSPEIETEHLLLGLLREDKALARRFLGTPWAAEAVWRKIAQSKPVREKLSGPRELPLSRTSKHVLAFAAEEADLLSNKYVCTEHLLLGLLIITAHQDVAVDWAIAGKHFRAKILERCRQAHARWQKLLRLLHG